MPKEAHVWKQYDQGCLHESGSVELWSARFELLVVLKRCAGVSTYGRSAYK